MNWCENKREISLSFLLPCSCAPNRERAFHKCVWYTWVNTFPMLIFCTAVHLSPTESRNSKLLTRWLQMPDRAPSLIGLHGASISLIGQDYGISERRNDRGMLKLEENEELRRAHLIMSWLTRLQRGRGAVIWASQRRKQNKLSRALILGPFRILLISFFLVDSSRYTLCSKYIFKPKIVLCVQQGFMRAVVSLRCCVSLNTCI